MSARSQSTVIEPYDIGLHYATTPTAWARLVRRFDFEDADTPECIAQTRIVTHSTSRETHLVIWVDLAAHRDAAAHLLGSLAHEATHAALMLLEHVGQPVKSDEASAYLVDYLTRWLATHTPTLALTLTAMEDQSA